MSELQLFSNRSEFFAPRQALGNSCFVSCETDGDGLVIAVSKAARESEMLKLRLCAERKVLFAYI